MASQAELDNAARWARWRIAVEDGWDRRDSYDYWLHPRYRIRGPIGMPATHPPTPRRQPWEAPDTH